MTNNAKVFKCDVKIGLPILHIRLNTKANLSTFAKLHVHIHPGIREFAKGKASVMLMAAYEDAPDHASAAPNPARASHRGATSVKAVLQGEMTLGQHMRHARMSV